QGRRLRHAHPARPVLLRLQRQARLPEVRPVQERQGPLCRHRAARPDPRHRDVEGGGQGHLSDQGQGDGQALHCGRGGRADGEQEQAV
ncbi:hypothetical protein LTR16_011003, partial [Cryomyces antarcticus]